MAELGVRYMIDDVPAAVRFYTTPLGFTGSRGGGRAVARGRRAIPYR